MKPETPEAFTIIFSFYFKAHTKIHTQTYRPHTPPTHRMEKPKHKCAGCIEDALNIKGGRQFSDSYVCKRLPAVLARRATDDTAHGLCIITCTYCRRSTVVHSSPRPYQLARRPNCIRSAGEWEADDCAMVLRWCKVAACAVSVMVYG